jgi:hypothetical protein
VKSQIEFIHEIAALHAKNPEYEIHYSVLVIEGQALKDWFIETTGQHLIGQKPLNLQRPKNIKSSAGKKS